LAAPALEPLAQEYANKGFAFLFLYTREAHPGENFQARKLEQKLLMPCFPRPVQIERPILVDDRRYGHKLYGSSNMTYIIGRGGNFSFVRTGRTRQRSNGRLDTFKAPVRADAKAYVAPFYAESSVIAGTSRQGKDLASKAEGSGRLQAQCGKNKKGLAPDVNRRACRIRYFSEIRRG
jgi:hypothetical protein